MWSQLSAEQKTNYGEDYFETALRSLEKYTEKVSFKCFSKVCTVTEIIAAAFLLKLQFGFFFGCFKPIRRQTLAQPFVV